jgi:tetratricopeptide (TPR) repeat protein
MSEITLDDTAPLDGPAAPATATAPGGTVGRFVVLGSLGMGGMGIVLAAHDPVLDRKVALKLLRPDDWRATTAEGRERLQREAQAMARLNHPNVATVYEVGAVGEQPFVAMELVDGQTLRGWLRERRSAREIVAQLVAAGRGLAAAHAAGLVHRDFKPDNVLVGRDGRPRVSDFGLVSLRSGSPVAGERAFTTSQGGTPGYMAPEQLAGGATDARSDQFSFCVALYDALYGERPFAATAPPSERRAPERPPRRPEVPARLYPLIARGLQPSPDARWPSLSELLDALERDPASARRRWIAGAAVAAALSVAVVAVRARPDGCGGATARLAGVWDDGVRRAVHAAFSATGLPFSEDTFARTSAALDRYVRGWVEMHEQACRATRVEHRQSDTLLDLRFGCLERARATTGALTALWSSGVDAAALAKAVDAASSLPPLSECADAAALSERTPMPRDPATVARIAATRGRLDRARALYAAQRWSAAKAEADGARADAEAAAWPELRAEVALVGARVQLRLEDRAAEQSFLDAAAFAGAAHDDRLAALAVLQLAGYLASRQAEIDRGLFAARLAEGLVERVGGDDLRGRLALSYGIIYVHQSRFEEAKQSLTRARTLLTATVGARDTFTSDATQMLARAYGALGDDATARKLLEEELALTIERVGPVHVEVVNVLNNLGAVLDDANDYAAAIEQYRRALTICEQVLPDSATHAGVLADMAASEQALDRFADAGQHYERALAIEERELGPDHPRLAIPLANLSSLALQQGRLDEAVALARRALAIQTRTAGKDNASVGYPLVHLGDALLYHHDFDAAIDAYEQSLALRRRALGPDHPLTLMSLSALGTARCARRQYTAGLPLLREVAEKLEARASDRGVDVGVRVTSYGRCLLDAGQPAAALPVLERALALLDGANARAADRATVRWLRARALWATGAKARAVEDARVAERDLTAPGVDYIAKQDGDDARAWLKTHAR